MDGTNASPNLDAANSLFNLGNQFARSGEWEEALLTYRKVLQLDPGRHLAHFNLGVVLGQQGELEAALHHYQQAIALNPSHVDSYLNLAEVLLSRGEFARAIAACEQALAMDAGLVNAYFTLSAALVRADRAEEAIAACKKALELRPDFAEIYCNLGYALYCLQRYCEAIFYLEKSIHYKPDLAEAYANMGIALFAQNRCAAAIACYDRAIQLNPNHVNANLNKGLALLATGSLLEGFALHEWRLRTRFYDSHPPFPQPMWDGTPFQGTLLVWMDGGCGDAIQLIRYAPAIASRCERVLFHCLPSLRRLFATVEGITELMVEGAIVPAFDRYIPLMSLPQVMGTTLDTIPHRVPYLSSQLSAGDTVPTPPPTLAFFGDGLKVGIVWASGRRDDSDLAREYRRRSCSLDLFLEAFAVPGVQLFSLQVGQDAAADDRYVDLSPQIRDFADTAALIGQLDLVITVDTSVAHLAGALGKPVWVLLKYNPDWRWLLDRDDSPWYPTMRLFRQRYPDDWRETLTRMRQALLSHRVEGVKPSLGAPPPPPVSEKIESFEVS